MADVYDPTAGQGPTFPRPLREFLWPHFFDYLRIYLEPFDVEIRFVDLHKIYASDQVNLSLRKLNYTGLSDGRTIFLHEDKQRIGSAAKWAWDALHLFGHMVQWHAPPKLAHKLRLSIGRERARVLGTMDFVGSDPVLLREMQTYEIEANCVAYGVFQNAVRSIGHPRWDSDSLLSEYRTYVASDIAFVTNYYLADAPPPSSDLLDQASIKVRLEATRLPEPSEIHFSQIPLCVPVLH